MGRVSVEFSCRTGMGRGGGGGIERADGGCWRLCVFCWAFVWFLPLSLVIAVFPILSKAIASFISLARQ